MSIVNLYKPLGMTPLCAIETLRTADPRFLDSAMVYAGRLDPMAEGVMVVLTDDDRYALNKYLGLDKTYEATMLFGFESDTYDALGIANEVGDVDGHAVVDALNLIEGVHDLSFPAYSAYRVKGKPLHWWARAGRLGEVEIPTTCMRVLNVRDINVGHRESASVLHDVCERIGLVEGDFRQHEIVARWKDLLVDAHLPLVVATITMDVASGTYVRSITNDVGARLGCGALLLSLKRTRVGGFDVSESRTFV